jgi:hypothetical protein
VFTLENYFALKSSTADGEAFSNAYPDGEVPIKTTMLMSPVRFFIIKFIMLNIVHRLRYI